jgi:hypothetical protein
MKIEQIEIPEEIVELITYARKHNIEQFTKVIGPVAYTFNQDQFNKKGRLNISQGKNFVSCLLHSGDGNVLHIRH